MTAKPILAALTIGAALAFGPCASACLNDRQIVVAEKEFRSSYLKPKPEPTLAERVTPGGWIAGGLGVAFLGMTFFVARGSRKGK